MSVDSLINYEAVKVHRLSLPLSLARRRLPDSPSRCTQYFNNEAFEVAQYDRAMKDYTKASVKISTSLAALNIGQNVIFSSALTAMMYLAAKGIMDGASALPLALGSRSEKPRLTRLLRAQGA